MNYKDSSEHALLSPSNCSWLNYDDDQFLNHFNKMKAKQRGTRLHDLAKEMIELGIKLPKTKETFNMYVNDCILHKMKCEQLVFYSENCYGTADAINFNGVILRVFDLKTGKSKTKIEQLIIYACIYCLENNIDIKEIDIELRIYQNNSILMESPTYDIMMRTTNTIIYFDNLITKLEKGVI